ncbi:SDR family oxidoreductase [Kribbella sp. NPDC004536]|uniref:SDR family oxidoreductase n=1 Tax=Kribbella sp. NPDC004536 TaxID=3364106 RepID=UPI003689532C
MDTAVLITGCSSGIGRATALAFARTGRPTWATARNPAALDELAAAGCRTMALDVTDEESRTAAVRRVESEHGAVGVLVNNAGYAQTGPVEEVTLELLRRQFETNLFGLIRMTQLVLPGMRAAGGGRIVNVGSAGGLMPFPGVSAYAMTKWSLEALSDALRYETRSFGVDVVLLEPGGVVSNFAATEEATWPKSASSPYAGFHRNHSDRMTRFNRAGAPGMSVPEDVARVIVRASTTRRPRTRYKVGVAPRVLPLLYRILPNRSWDAFVGRLFPV